MKYHEVDPTLPEPQNISSGPTVSLDPRRGQCPSAPSCRPPGPCPTRSASHTIAHVPNKINFK